MVMPNKKPSHAAKPAEKLPEEVIAAPVVMSESDQAVLAALDTPEPVKRAPVVMMADDPKEVVAAVQATLPGSTPKEPYTAPAAVELVAVTPPLSDRTKAEMEAGRNLLKQYQ